MDSSSEGFIRNVDVAIKDGRILSIDKSKDGEFKADKVIDGRHKLVMPGLINTHTHSAMTILRNYADDLPLKEWLFDHIFPIEAKLTEEDVYWGTMLAIAEMIKSGTTTIADMYLFMDKVAQAVSETGMRAGISKGPLKFSNMQWDANSVVDYHKRWHNSANQKIKVHIEVHSVYMFNRQSLIDAAKLAKELNTGIFIHILETKNENQECIKKYGKGVVEICAETGIFDVPVIAAHCVHATGEDIKILKSYGVNVSHNPTSNLKLGSGIANVPEMLSQGVNVSLGTDGTASNNNLDMFEEINLAALIHKGTNLDSALINARQAILMATINGAKALGADNEIGSIRPGNKADLIVLDIDKPHFWPTNNPFSAIAYSAGGQDVSAVIIDGEILMDKGQLLAIDEEKIKFNVNEIWKSLQMR